MNADQHRRRDHGEDPDRHVDQEDRPPAEAEQVVLDEQPAEQRPAHRAEAGGDAEPGQCLDPLGRREDDLDDGEHLRDHDRAHRALHHPAGNQHARALRGAAQRRHDREAGHADQEQALAPERVAEPPAGDQDQRVGERVPGQGPLHVRIAGVQVALDGRDRDVDDGHVEEVHESGQQQDDQGQPAPRVNTFVPGPPRCQDLSVGCHVRSPLLGR
jgi:hypothetical protein